MYKKFTVKFILFIVIIGLASCQNELKEEYSISVDPTELMFGAEGGESSVTVTSSDAWELDASGCSWISASLSGGESGAAVTLTAEANAQTEARTGTVIFKCGDKTAEVAVMQVAKEYSIAVDPTELTFSAEGGEKTIKITCPDEWTISSDEYWCRPSVHQGMGDTEVTITMDPYTGTAESRIAVLTFKSGDKTVIGVATQTPKEYFISVEPAELVFSSLGGTQQIKVNSSDEWSASTNEYWASLSSFSGKGGDVITVSTYEHWGTDRTNIFTFTCGDKTVELKVTQKADDSPIIQFSDPNFLSTLLEEGVDRNGDGQISEAEASRITSLSIYDDKGISNIDEIAYFTSLTHLFISGNYISRLDIGQCKELEDLYLGSGILSELNVSGCAKLKKINIWNNSLTSLDLSGMASLVEVDCHSNEISELNLKGCTALVTLSCWSNNLETLDISSCTSLRKMDCMFNELKFLDLSKNKNLMSIDCGNNELINLDLSNNDALIELDCESNEILVLDLHSNQRLAALKCGNNPLEKIILYKNNAVSDTDINTIISTYGDIIEYQE